MGFHWSAWGVIQAMRRRRWAQALFALAL